MADGASGGAVSARAGGAARSERRGGADIFIGGGFDDLPGFGVMRQYAEQYAAETGRPTLYFPNARTAAVVDAIARAAASGGPVNVIGHSYGGPDAYAAVARANRAGVRVDNLVTLDPVSGPSAAIRGVARPGTWMNVRAEADRPDQSDWIADRRPFSYKPSALPVEQADRAVSVRLNHRDVDEMMRQSGARALLDASRRSPADPGEVLSAPPTADELHDNLPMMEWMRRRQGDAGGGRR